MTTTKTELEEKLKTLTAFMGSELYKEYLIELEARAAGHRISILSRPPINDQERAEVLMLHGQLSEVCSDTIFESMRNELKAEIDKCVESETLVANTEE